MKIGGDAQQSVSLSDLRREPNLRLASPIRILGNGSNVLIDDQGLKGSVILCRDSSFQEPEILSESDGRTELRCSPGSYLPSFARWAQRQAYTGAEFMVGVPGTLGGAIVQNAGASGQETKEIVKSVETLKLESRELRELSLKELSMSYRSSALHGSDDLIVSCRLAMKKASPDQIQAAIEKNLAYRKDSTPYTKPSLGSIFTRLEKPGGGWLFPGKLIEDCGLKGFRIGGASVSPEHANYIVNDGSASFEDVYALILHIESEVQKNFGLKMRREIELWTDRSLEEMERNLR